MVLKWVTFLVVFLYVFPINNGSRELYMYSITREEELELEKEVQSLNKPPVKTFQLEEGDIIDCIDINKQPALDHPLLKNHKIQLVLVILKERPDYKYHGVMGKMSIHNITVGEDQSSSTNIWVGNGPPDQVNYIAAGLMMSPMINGDSLPRMFTYWTGDVAQRTGCFNMDCKGFVQVHKIFAPKYLFPPPYAVYGGQMIDHNFQLLQDKETKNWWLVLELKTPVGYFPKELFPYLSEGAGVVEWGAVAKTGKNGISPPMGNGYKPNRVFDQSSYFRRIRFVDGNFDGQRPSKHDTENYEDPSGCYKLINDKDYGGQLFSYYFLYGGPGGQCGNNSVS
ncbi:hypothetical protein JRO89_XS02G0288400 [Xanthoceras sorbifolium]|uniref:Neprosin PEP catalytic domain-containing protein n=1 Tax=Xanthoceras sorbifolium TaxID=99658 RepID=A0ABQ8II22_9ROSI|nr:hypothetical protein JRO89_XS02G0288400 [Xanthoceras sorbifolium]